MIQNNTTVHKSFTVLLPHALFHSKGSEQPSDMIQKKYTCAQIIHSITPKPSSYHAQQRIVSIPVTICIQSFLACINMMCPANYLLFLYYT